MEKIEKEIISEWEDFYIDYNTLESIIHPLNFIKNNNVNNERERNQEKDSLDNSLNERLLSYNQQNEEENKNQKLNLENINAIFNKYITQINLEINKFSYFNNLLQNKRHSKRFEEIIQQLKYTEKNSSIKMFKQQLEESLKNFYREISNYQAFINTNISIKNLTFENFEKSIEKIKIQMNQQIDTQNYQEKKNEVNQILQSSYEYNKKLLKDIEIEYTYFFENKYINEEKTTKEILQNFLTPEKEKSEIKNIKILNFLLFTMIIFGSLCLIMHYYLQIDIDLDPEFSSLFPMYRTYGIVCLYLWTLGLNVWVWNKADINYKALFTFDNHYSTVIEIFIRASAFTNILFIAFFIYMLTRTQFGINSGINIHIDEILPGLIWSILFLYFFWPFKSFNYCGRIYTMRLFGESIASILIPIEFKHIWFMDQLTSLIGPMRDLEYTLCYYSYYVNPFQTRELICSNPRLIYLIIAILPNLFRCLQVGRQMIDNNKIFPYIFNIGKYTFNIIVATFSFLSQFHIIFYYFWLANAFISGCYSSFWDLKMDWGYFESNSYNWPLRNKTKFKKKLLCILSIPVDIILRFLWMLSISPEIMSQYIKPEFLALVLYTLEMIRRAIWNFIRVEFEHYELEKMYQISFYEELPLIKLSNGKYMTNENKLLNILDVEKKDRMILELRELFNSLDKDKKKSDINKETSLNHLIENKKYEKNIKTLLDEYLTKYKYDSNQNSFN